jgi:hypothetical protein
MSVEYYHLDSVVLDDDMYIDYGGRTGTSTAAQRSAAYQAAEQMMIRELRSFLIPTTVTGTWEFNNFYPKRYRLPFFHVKSIDAVSILSQQSLCNCTITERDGCAFIVDSLYGVVDIRQLVSSGLACGCSLECPYQVRVAFTSGLPTGVAANDSQLHLALTIVAELFLLEIIDPKALEGGPGDAGVQEWVSMGYGEKRTKLMRTVFGSSARANKAKELVQHLTPKVAGKLGR